MNATMSLEKINHFPVMLDQILSIITPQHGGTFIDCTFGSGGYSKEILKHPKSSVIAFDRDKNVKPFALEIEKIYGEKFQFFNQPFSNISSKVKKTKNLKAIIFDLGFSLMQIKDLERGFSFDSKGNLDMRMGFNKYSANDVINYLDQNQIGKILKYFGEEKDYKKIAFQIIKEREKKLLNTEDLVYIIKKIKKNPKKFKKNVATKSFQAIRIFVNKEINELVKGLIEATKILNPGNILLVVTFHSLEDKVVKFFFKNYSEIKKNPSRYLPKIEQKDKRLFDFTNKKPILPSDKEIKKNPASRSAKLRYAIRNEKDFFYPDELTKKFENYLNLENIELNL